MHVPKFKTGFAVFALVLLAGLIGIALVPRRGPPDVAINLLGYTNDSSGTKMARIGVTNLSAFKILVYLPIVQIESPSDRLGFTNYFAGGTNQWRRFHTMLGEGESGSFMIPPPSVPPPSSWRLSFFAYCDYGFVERIKNIVARRQHPYRVNGAWLANEFGAIENVQPQSAGR